MRSWSAVRPNRASERALEESANMLVRKAVWAQERVADPPILLLASDNPEPTKLKSSWQRFRWSGTALWAWEDLNLRPHPYQQSSAKRCADYRFPRSHATVRREVMRSKILAQTGTDAPPWPSR
jgi:hypothetical protein